MSPAHLTAALPLVAAILASPAGALQQGGPEIQRIAYGETVTGFLTLQDDSLQDGSRYKAYYFQGRSGDSITILMSSRELNAHVILTDVDDNVLNSDANGGGRCDAHLTHILPAAGDYFIFANAEDPGELGQYQLTLSKGIQSPPARTPCRGFTAPQGILPVGDSVTGKLGQGDRIMPDSGYYVVWLVIDAAGKTVTADLVSEDFDSRLILVRGFDEAIGVNDDGGGGCNARLVFTASDRTPLRLVVVARPARRGGGYLLRLTEGAQPVESVSRCVPPGGGSDAG